MARRVNQGPSESTEEMGDRSMTPGGADGVIPDAAKDIPNPGVAEASAFREPPADAPKAKQFMVMNAGGVHIMYGGVRTLLKQNKVIDETTYDLELLRRQGVQLRELT